MTTGPRFIALQTVDEPRGNLAVLEEGGQLPFPLRHVEWSYPSPGTHEHQGLACRHSEQVVVAVSGSFDAVVDDGTDRGVYAMNRPNRALYVPPGHWCELHNVSANAVRLVAASLDPTDDELAHDRDDYLQWLRP